MVIDLHDQLPIKLFLLICAGHDVCGRAADAINVKTGSRYFLFFARIVLIILCKS